MKQPYWNRRPELDPELCDTDAHVFRERVYAGIFTFNKLAVACLWLGLLCYGIAVIREVAQ